MTTEMFAWSFVAGVREKSIPWQPPPTCHKINLKDSSQIKDNECYVILTLADENSSGDKALLQSLMEKGNDVLTPRGTTGHVPLLGAIGNLWEEPVGTSEKEKRIHKIYVWNGVNAPPLVRATALTEGLQLQQILDMRRKLKDSSNLSLQDLNKIIGGVVGRTRPADTISLKKELPKKIEKPLPKLPFPKLNLKNIEGPSQNEEEERKRKKLEHFEVQCSKILDNMFLASEKIALDRSILKENGITHVLNCAGLTIKNEFEKELKYLTLYLTDSPTEDIRSHLYDSFEFIDTAISDGGKVLVHCHQGVSRSGAISIAYVMYTKNMGYDEAYQYVRERRGVCNPNAGFAAQLMQWYKHRTIKMKPNETRLYRAMKHICPPTADVKARGGGSHTHLISKVIMPSQDHFGVNCLDPRTCILVQTSSLIAIWKGSQSPSIYYELLHDVMVERLKIFENASDSSVLVIEQGNETDVFWDMFRNTNDTDRSTLPWPKGVREWDDIYGEEKEEKGGLASIGHINDDSPEHRRGNVEEEEEPKEEPKRDITNRPRMFHYDDWEEYTTYDSDDLDTDEIFGILYESQIFIWLGSDVDFAKDPHEIGNDLIRHLSLPTDHKVVVVREGEESDFFWDELFPNG